MSVVRCPVFITQTVSQFWKLDSKESNKKLLESQFSINGKVGGLWNAQFYEKILVKMKGVKSSMFGGIINQSLHFACNARFSKKKSCEIKGGQILFTSYGTFSTRLKNSARIILSSSLDTYISFITEQ